MEAWGTEWNTGLAVVPTAGAIVLSRYGTNGPCGEEQGDLAPGVCKCERALWPSVPVPRTCHHSSLQFRDLGIERSRYRYT